MKKTTQLKNLIQRKKISFLMEAHSGLSAKIVEEAGFEGIWGSGLSISAAQGVRDNNELSWTQVLDVVEYMSDVTSIPILLDGDTGHGNFNNMRRFVKKLEQRGIAGVCIEDKIFPKTNSFLRGEKQPLANIDEFCGKIKAGLDVRTDDDFSIVARVEAFIAGWGLEEALKRANAYYEAGATAILMHSKLSKPDEIFSFMKEWGDRCPVVIVPTKFYSTPTEQFAEHSISTVIWANHLLRSSITAMQKTAQQIFNDQSLINVEDKVASVQEIFRLQNDQELENAEKVYLSNTNSKKAIILAASRGKELGNLTLDKPKTLIKINGETILHQLVNKYQNHGVDEAVVIRGYKKEIFPDIKCTTYIDNDEYEETGELTSLFKAKDYISGDIIISYGDIAFRNYILNELNEVPYDIAIVVDGNISRRSKEYLGDYVYCTNSFTKSYNRENSMLIECNLNSIKNLKTAPQGEWIGLIKANTHGSKVIKETLEKMNKNPDFKTKKMGDLFNHMISKDIQIGICYIDGHWLDVDNIEDIEQMQVF
ncbi:MAG: phosphoenolpyruvate mutase [Halobacteriovoraceae bacterium]|nr:phosphoenolpyruvate mutase [Halobacteriovoraceae bacterium]